MLLLRAGRLGAFDFNSRFYADDDLMVGAADPFQLFRIMYEVVRGGRAATPTPGVAFMLDQCHNIEPKIPGQIRSVMNVQEATAKALLVDRDALRAAQRGRRRARRERGADGRATTPTCGRCSPSCARTRAGPRPDARPTPASGYEERIAAERVGGTAGRLGR